MFDFNDLETTEALTEERSDARDLRQENEVTQNRAVGTVEASPVPSPPERRMQRPRLPRRLAPRPPLCYYFSRDRPTLLRELEEAYRHRHGPGSLPSRRSARAADKAVVPQIMLLVSHGASCDSFPVVAHAFHLLAAHGVPPTVLILGTDHRGIGAPVALSTRPWQTPLGQMEVDTEVVEELAEKGYCVDETGHSQEHSIENQLPFLQHLAPDVKIVPVGVSRLSNERARQLAEDVVMVTRGRSVLILATTDYMHAGEGYYDQPPRAMHLHEFIRKCDQPVLDAIQAISPEKTILACGQRGMCGLWPAVVILHCASLRGFTSVRLLKYAVSGEVWPAAGCTGFASWSFAVSPGYS